MFTTAPIEEVKKAIKDLEHTYTKNNSSKVEQVVKDASKDGGALQAHHDDLEDAKKTLASLQLKN